jgi:hypothetical protein
MQNITLVDDLTTLDIIGNRVTFVSNDYVRKGKEIPNNAGWLVSHIACDLPQFNKKGEYDFSKLWSYNLVLLGDIHTAFEYEKGRIYYTSSPYRTHRKTIESLDEIDNSFYGYIRAYEDSKVEKVELNLPNMYVWKQSQYKEVPKDIEDFIEVELQVSIDDLDQYRDKGVGITVTTNDIELDLNENFEDAVSDYLQKTFDIKDFTPYLEKLYQVYPEAKEMANDSYS